jgi:hypothetical protein
MVCIVASFKEDLGLNMFKAIVGTDCYAVKFSYYPTTTNGEIDIAGDLKFGKERTVLETTLWTPEQIQKGIAVSGLTVSLNISIIKLTHDINETLWDKSYNFDDGYVRTIEIFLPKVQQGDKVEVNIVFYYNIANLKPGVVAFKKVWRQIYVAS